MAAAATLPAMPAPARLPRTTKGHASMPFDATILCAKLEAHQRKHEDVELEPIDKSNRRTKRASYVPQNAAKQFVATTTPMNQADAGEIKRAKSTKQQRPQRPLPTRSMSDYHADGKPGMNPKKLQALLSNSMSETEAAAAANNDNDIPTRQSSNSSASTDSTWNDTTIRRQKRQSNLLASKDRTSKDATATKRTSRDHKPGDTTKRRSQGYKPGDAAKRNAEKRQSIQPQGKLIAIKHGSQTTYEREYTLDFGSRMAKTAEHESAIADVEDDADRPLHTFRPKLQSHDRPNWTQQSQCGDSMHDLLHPVWAGRRRKSKTTTDREDALAALTGDATPVAPLIAERPRNLGRQRSLNDLPAEHLVSDAVKKIKQDEKRKRRQSIVSFFKRL